MMVPLSGAMVHWRGLTLVAGRPLVLPGNILVGCGVVGGGTESTLGRVVGAVVAVGPLAVGCGDPVFKVYFL